MSAHTLDLPRSDGQPSGRVQRVLVVVPAYNEALSIREVLRELRAAVPGVRILVVDDGSLDGTAQICRREQVQCLVLPFNLGVGGAMRAGFLYAWQQGFQVVVQVDADGQHDPGFVPALIAELARGADVVVGSRFANGGRYHVSPSRRVAMALVSRLLSRACDVPLTDATSGFRAAGPRAVALFARTYPADYLGDTLESLILARRAGLVIRELPVTMRQRSAGRPSQGFGSSVRYLLRSGFLIAIGSQTRPESARRESRGPRA